MQPNTPMVVSGQQKFAVPTPLSFSVSDSWMSVVSLFAFLIASILAIWLSSDIPTWAVVPFWFTAFGSGLGFLYELWLLLRKTPYQLLATPIGRFIQPIRLANLAPVF